MRHPLDRRLTWAVILVALTIIMAAQLDWQHKQNEMDDIREDIAAKSAVSEQLEADLNRRFPENLKPE